MDPLLRRAGYSTREVASLLGLSPVQVRACVRAGFVTPQTGPHGEMVFSFQDLVLLRTAKSLLAAHIPRRRIGAVLQRLHVQLPQGRPLTGVRISAQGGTVVARDGGDAWQPESGQTLLDFEAVELERDGAGLREGTSGAFIPNTTRSSPAASRARSLGVASAVTGDGESAASAAGAGPATPWPAPQTAAEWYELGVQLEDDDPAAATASYRRALDLDRDLADAHLNLGRLLHEAGDPTAAEIHYRLALAARPTDPLAAYNLGVALEDQRHLEQAVAAYLQAIQLDPRLADAHFNLSGLYEQLGDKPAAFRHLRTYSSLIGHRGGPS